MTYPFSVESYHPNKIVVSPEPGSIISSVCRAAAIEYIEEVEYNG